MFYIGCLLYILTPFFFTMLWKWFKLPYIWFTFILTSVVVIVFIPEIISRLDFILNPPLPITAKGMCGMPTMAYYIANIIFCLPLTLGVQLLFNVLLLKSQKKI